MARRNKNKNRRVRDKTARGLLYNDKKFGLDLEKTLFETTVEVDSGRASSTTCSRWYPLITRVGGVRNMTIH